MSSYNTSSSVSNDGTHKSAALFIFLILILPFGIMTGYLTVTLAFLFSKAGISIEQVAGLVAASLIPQIFKFIWAPLVDVTLSVKKWHVIATVTSAACIFITGIIPIKASSLPILTVLIIVSNFAVSFVSIAVNSLSAYDIPEDKKGRVSGYVQAGYMGGTGVGGGAGLWMAQHLNYAWMPGAVLGFVCILCSIGLFFIEEPKVTVRVTAFRETMRNVLQDVWVTLKTKKGLLALILVLVPIGTCAVSTLFAAIASDWNAGATIVALITGVAGGFITGAGSLAGGWISDKMHRRTAYLLFGLLQIGCTLGMAFFPHTPNMYITWTLLYSITAGMAYAGYNAFTLEAIGKGAAATKFEVYASVSNVPIYLITFVEGLTYTKWGANGVLYTEAACATVAILLFIIIERMVNMRKSTQVASFA
jgi:PAT family beta-lactamase induction signal transducer AmpG